MGTRQGCFGVALAFALSAPAAAEAAPTVRALSDVASVAPAGSTANGETLLAAQRTAMCKRVTKPRTVKFTAALRTAGRVAGNARGAKRLSRSADGRTHARAMSAAAGALAQGRPKGALAALLRAHHLKPRDPGTLISAAAVLVELEKPNEALALLARADGKATAKLRRSGAFDIRPSAALANNRGYALLAQGRWKPAGRELAKAIRQAPLLAEARRNQAHAELCQGKVAAAHRTLIAAARRQPATPGDPPKPAGELLDLAHGTAPTLPDIEIPATTPRGKALSDSLAAAYYANFEQSSALALADGEATLALNAALSNKPPATAKRLAAVLAASRLTGTTAPDPELRRLAEAERTAWQQMSHARSAAFETPGDTGENAFCVPALRDALYLQIVAYDRTMREYAVAEYRYRTAIAATVAEPALHRVLMVEADQKVAIHLASLLQVLALTGSITDWDRGCYKPPSEPDGAGYAPPGLPDSASCPAGLRDIGFQANLTVATVTISCQEASLELSTPGWLGGFAQITHSPGSTPSGLRPFGTSSNATTTVFAGPKAQSNPTGFGPNTTVKDGVYVTFGADGGVQDAGLRVDVSADVSINGTGAAVQGTTMDFTFVGAGGLGT
ncbi:MAG TPA: hypothetical protein VNS09_11675 [Solirubrobacter sp.]|nr:hypothetical protein [Solirubrobacter sp.]